MGPNSKRPSASATDNGSKTIRMAPTTRRTRPPKMSLEQEQDRPRLFGTVRNDEIKLPKQFPLQRGQDTAMTIPAPAADHQGRPRSRTRTTKLGQARLQPSVSCRFEGECWKRKMDALAMQKRGGMDNVSTRQENAKKRPVPMP